MKYYQIRKKEPNTIDTEKRPLKMVELDLTEDFLEDLETFLEIYLVICFMVQVVEILTDQEKALIFNTL